MSATAMSGTGPRPMTAEEKKVIFASSLGTVFEWYDFYLYGALSAIIAQQFFSNVNPTAAFILALLAFAAGFAVRPFGALVFGRIGDMIGRKYAFLATIVIMGLATFLVGLLPSFASWGVAAPAILVGLRLLQGLALGGEYGGAAIYVAEHAPQERRGFYTGWIQTTATLGLFLALLVILGTRTYFGEPAFAAWAWRIPFLASIVLLGLSVWIRLALSESPIFRQMKAAGTLSKAPITEAFGRWTNAKVALVALLGGTAGQAVVWYTGHFYVLFFLTRTLGVDDTTASILIVIALVIGTPFFVFFGWLSDKIGRKVVILGGCLIAAVTYFPIFETITGLANPDLRTALRTAPATVVADPAECSFQFNPVETARFTSSCDIAKAFLATNSVSYHNEAAAPGTVASVHVGETVIPAFQGTGLAPDAFKAKSAAFDKAMTEAIREAGYPEAADPERMNRPMIVVMLVVLMLLVAMVYGPMAAWLVELFPARIRYTGISLPYHIGNGWFGGFLPTAAFAMVAATGDIYYGLWYPIVVAVMTFVVGLVLAPETRDRDIAGWH